MVLPGSSLRMLAKSKTSSADCVAYDLEDSVAIGNKAIAREQVAELLDGDERELARGERMVRINSLSSVFAEEDLKTVLKTRHLQALALPKLNSADELQYLISMIQRYRVGSISEPKIKIVALVETAKAVFGLGDILKTDAKAKGWQGYLDGLIFGAEDYCADTGIERTESRTELLYARSEIANAARAHGLQAIDLVCVEYKDLNVLESESLDGRRLGFTGKQAIHPGQVDVIQQAYSPSMSSIQRAARILHASALHEAQGRGAFELEGKMIDVPVVKQAESIIAQARSVGLAIPHVKT